MANRQFPVLEQKMRERRVKRPMMADAIGRSQATLSEKMSGKRQFTLREIVVIRDTFFPGCLLDDLFRQ